MTWPLDEYHDRRPIVVVGGGFAGASFALAAASPECPVLVVEAVVPGAGDDGFDARSTALSWGTRRIFESLGVWDELGAAPCPIHRIEVTDRGHLGGVSFDHREQQQEALGYVVENHALGKALQERLAASEHIDVLAPANVASARPVPEGMELRIRQDGNEHELTTALTVLADGGRSPIAAQLGIGRQLKSYGQHALVANIALERAHRNIAYERFTEHGPLAVLPLPAAEEVHRASLVWTLPEALAREYLELPEDELLPLLQGNFGPGMGSVAGIGRRACFPLQLSRAGEQARPGLALLGNAAHTLHPVAGQGFNLALRDCQALAGVVREAAVRGQWPGDMAVLQAYIDEQEFDQEKTILFTDLLVGLFSGKSVAKATFRRLGLLALDLLPPVRRRFVSNAMGLGSF
ncbi:MAG: 2-octaprenyl-6-methoxyphenyl hydroxylase [Gammaproteobacteria bacterium]|nr:2-octaprenyl-6-methoxyphenyl hydroxylase [Gammaproteobacteria bacterium]MDE0479701.1 2-octaprenyl-6-methoxyphenyl hydroxylase [Gammaproteobacteria bacterium]MYA36346.1 2-octaprenyl-6-methoxyphenyl hydroxylase [Gammaproteobacteria bacterium]MYH85815.1 2-octaprenyl-6-methoxyphenyl hydroxylase [Gammaproteobacteria bacterium]MYK05327.1 2-octaprenyl-6-methoxyphenyl hydroxylase [Gammaproteobacteria bacterium]